MKRCNAAPDSQSQSGSGSNSNSNSSSSSCKSFKQPKKPRKCSKKLDNALPNSSSSNGRSSIYRGVTRHRWTGRFEAHLWDKSAWNSLTKKRGRQIYLGAYDSEEAAAHTYDLAALKYWGSSTTLNFPIETYNEEVEEMEKLNREEYLASLRRRSSGFSRGVSKYRGVARHHHNGRWEARIGRVRGNKYLYLGTYSTQEEAAAAYDLAAIEYRGVNAVTNFDISNYADRLISSNSPISSIGKTKKRPRKGKSNDEEQKVEQQSSDAKNLIVEEGEEKEIQLPDVNLDQNLNFEELTSPQVVDEYIQEPDQNDWMLCLDDTLPVPDIPLEKPDDGGDMLDLFDDTGCFQFEDNIDFLFDAPPLSPLSSSSTTTSISSAF